MEKIWEDSKDFCIILLHLVEPRSPLRHFFCNYKAVNFWWTFPKCQWKMGRSSFWDTKITFTKWLYIYIISIYIYILIYQLERQENMNTENSKSPNNHLLMEEILHQFIGSLPYYLQGFSTIPGGCLGFLPCQEYHRTFFGGGRVACQKTLQSPSCGGPTCPGHVADLHSRLRSSSANTEERTRTKGWLGVCWVPFFHRKKS